MSNPDTRFQDLMLQRVSRTFALTIPQLPAPLDHAVGNAYLLCRIADTIEDDAALGRDQKQALSAMFIDAVSGTVDAPEFSNRLLPLLSASTSSAEHELISDAPRVLRITHSLKPAQQAAIRRCIRVMAAGMVKYQLAQSPGGLESLADLDRYCYYVAGVVGEMLTEMFCDHSPAVAEHRTRLMELAVSFGQGLQMTNILKDVWEDRRRGACWLPKDVFRAHGFELGDLSTERYDAAFGAGLMQLIAVARGHLHQALEYTLLIPKSERGIRRFCLWALGMAALTLRKLSKNLSYTSGRQVKIRRRSVRATTLLTNLAGSSDLALRALLFMTELDFPPPQGTRASLAVAETESADTRETQR